MKPLTQRETHSAPPQPLVVLVFVVPHFADCFLVTPNGPHFCRYADPAVAAELGVELVDLPTLFARSDYLTVNCPLMKATEKIVNAERLATMKSTACVPSPSPPLSLLEANAIAA